MKTLKQLRQEKGLNQIEMSILLNISYQNYRNYETGHYINMREDIRKKIGEIFNIEYVYIRK